MSSIFTWYIFQIIVNYFSPSVSVCVLNQFNNHWLLSNALQYAIIMCLKCKKAIANSPTQVNLIDDDFGIVLELSLFATDIKKRNCNV